LLVVKKYGLRNLARLNKRYKDVVCPAGTVRETMANNPFFNLLNEIELRNRKNRDGPSAEDTPPSTGNATDL
jgi:hypothetical protein